MDQRLSEREAERLRREERALRARITSFTAADRLSRDDVHARGAEARTTS
jgi:hypothetical protein